jgi:hypothetical protein
MTVPIVNDAIVLATWIVKARDENKVFKKLLRKFVLLMIDDSNLQEGIPRETVNLKLKASDSTTGNKEVIRVEYEIVAGQSDPAFDRVFDIWESLTRTQKKRNRGRE